MLKAKKLTSFILSACMAMGFGANVFASVPGDAQDSKYADAIEFIGGLAIFILGIQSMLEAVHII